jgi:hypothetical protein
MQLRQIANKLSSTVNPNITVSLQTSAGWTPGPGQRQTPKYNQPISGPAQIQALDNSDLKQIEGLNIQGALRALYMYGSLAGVIRPDSKGGDLITISSPAPAALCGTWLTSKVLESWPDWTKIVIVKQTAISPALSSVNLAVTAPAPGVFSVPHGLPGIPATIRLLMTSSGQIWTSVPAVDATNVYLNASDIGVTANVWLSL